LQLPALLHNGEETQRVLDIVQTKLKNEPKNSQLINHEIHKKIYA